METQLKKHIIECVGKIHALLNSMQCEPYSSSFEVMLRSLHSAPNEEIVIRNILKMYRGAGSFSDLVLSTAGNFYPQENMMLDHLRTRLYHLCVEYLEEQSRSV